MIGRATTRQEWRTSWRLAFAGLVGVSLPGLYVYSIGPLMDVIQQDRNWTRAEITFGMTMATFVAATMGPVIGVAVDRIGSRRIAIPGTMLFCLSIALLPLGRDLWSWWSLWALVGLCSAGVKPTVWASAVARSFHASRGFALAVLLCGTGLSSALVPLAATALAQAFGWRGAYLGLPMLWLVVSLPLTLLFFKVRDTTARDATVATSSDRRPSPWPLLLSRNYLLIVGAGMVCTLVVLAFTVSIVPILTGLGLARADAARFAGVIGLMSIAGRLLTGWLVDRADPRAVSAIGMALPAAAAAILLAAPSSTAVNLLAVGLIGLSLGGETGAVSFLIGRHFHTGDFGLLFGTATSGMAITTGLGPLLASYSFDLTGSYQLMLTACVPLSIVSASLLLLLPDVRSSKSG